MRRIPAAAGLALVLALASCTADATVEPVASGPTSGPDTGDVILRGSVLEDGDPLEGASVWIDLMPVGDILAELPEGATVETWSTDPVRTDGGGQFAISIDPDELGPTYFGGDFLNTDLNIEHGRTRAFWGHPFSRLGEVWRSDEHSAASDAVTRMTLDLGAETVVTTLSTGEKEKADLPVDH